MPWEESSAMDQKVRFVARYREGDVTMTGLCEAFGISRECGYKWVARYESEGVDGLKARSRAPLTHPNAASAVLVELVLDARRQHPTWGPRKLLVWLAKKRPRTALPAASSVATWLKSHGLAGRARRAKMRSAPTATPALSSYEAANACWSTDFKGQFKTRDGTYCYPLTMQDVATRYLIRCHGLLSTAESPARAIFASAFAEYGLPVFMRSDNGTPFSATSFCGLSALSAWWVSLGIGIDRIPPASPQHNGRIERMHRTLKAETTRPPARDLLVQQRTFNRFQAEYNNERPHEALDNATPSSLYVPSPRRFPRIAPEPQYPSRWAERMVSASGAITFGNRWLHVGKVLAGYRLGFEPVDEGIWAVHFFGRRLGEYDEDEATLACAGGVRRCAAR
jgi:putative transposase